MDNTFGGDFVSITDEEGNEFELELLDAIIKDGVYYHAFLPAPQEGESEEEEQDLIILKSTEENGQELLSTLDTDEELEEIYTIFMERLFEDEEDEEDEE